MELEMDRNAGKSSLSSKVNELYWSDHKTLLNYAKEVEEMPTSAMSLVDDFER